MVHRLFLLVCLLGCAGGTVLAQKANLTHPFLQVQGNVSWLGGTAVARQPQPGVGAALGMWSLAPGKMEWMMMAQYQLLRADVNGYQVDPLGVRDSGAFTLQFHQLDWTTLAVYHLAKPGLNVQAGAWVGVGLGGNLRGDDAIRVGSPNGVLTRLLHQSGELGFGTVLGLGFGSRYTQAHLRYVWDARNRDPSRFLRLRRSAFQAGVAFLLRDFVVF